MKQAATVCRYLLGLIFVFAGSNHLFNFLPSPAQTGIGGQFTSVMMASHYLFVVGIFEVGAGVLLLAGIFVPLGLTVLGAVIVNILLSGFLIDHNGILPGLIVSLLWLVVFWRYRGSFAGIFRPRPVLDPAVPQNGAGSLQS